MSHAGMDGEITAKQICSLQDSIEGFNQKATEQANEMIRLTIQIKYLTAVMALLAIVQICLPFVGRCLGSR